jgi:thymidylate kinase/predicted nucleotidyltransferase
MVKTTPASLKARFIYVTGSDGTGKTTQARRLYDALKASGIPAEHLWMRFPFFFSAPLLAYARLRGLSYYETKGDVRQGYWEFYKSTLLRVFFPWTMYLDAFLAAQRRVKLPLQRGKVIVCERFVLDMLVDLSIAMQDPEFHRKTPGRYFVKLLPLDNRVFILDVEIETLRRRRADLALDRMLQDRLEGFNRLAQDLSLRVLSGSDPIEKIQADIQEAIGYEVLKSTDSRLEDLQKLEKKRQKRSLWLALVSHWVFQSMLYMDSSERWFKLGLDFLLTALGTLLLKAWLTWPLAIGVSFVIAHSINFFINGQLFALLKNYGGVSHTYEQFVAYTDALAQRAQKEPSIQKVVMYGSISRRSWSHSSDLDARILRKPGLKNGIRAAWFLLKERTRALFSKFPLDMYVLDSERSLHDRRLKADEQPVLLEAKRT